MLYVLENQMKGTPMGDNLLYLARNNRNADIEQIAAIFAVNVELILTKSS